MSDYGADKNPDLNIATDLAFNQAFLPLAKANVMQWTHDSAISTIKIAHRKTNSNVHILLDNS